MATSQPTAGCESTREPSPEERAKGVVAASAGNHAQGLAFVAKRYGVAATIVMPCDAFRVYSVTLAPVTFRSCFPSINQEM